MARIRISGVIGDPYEGTTFDALDERLNEIAPDAPLEIVINSAGGFVDEGLGIHARLAEHQGPKHVTILGVAASMASAIACVGDSITMRPSSLWMVHSPWNISMGNAAAHRKQADTLDVVAGRLVGIYAARTGRDPDEIRAELEAESWFDAEQALAAGYCTAIAGASEPAALARVRLDHLALAKPVPAVLRQAVRRKPAKVPAMAATDEAPPPEDDTEEAPPPGKQPRSVGQERFRASRIGRICAAAGLEPEIADRFIREGASLEDVKLHVYDTRFAAQQQHVGQISNAARVTGGISHDSPEAVAEATEEALAAKLLPSLAVSERARGMAGMSMVELVDMRREARGEKPIQRNGYLGRARGEGALTTSDYPDLLQGAGRRALLENFRIARSELTRACREVQVPDFRTNTMHRLGAMPPLLHVPESGEIHQGPVDFEKESFRVYTWGRKISLSRQSLINDDLFAFSNLLQEMAATTALTERDQLVLVLTDNAAMNDGIALFHADHGNTASSTGGLTVDTLTAGIRAMKTQKIGGRYVTNIAPKYLAVGPSLEPTARVIVSSIQNPLSTGGANAANPLYNTVELLVEPLLDDISPATWFLFADESRLPWALLAYLDGTRPGATAGGPMLDRVEDPSNLNVSFRCVFDFGTAALNWRAAYRAVT
jgi:ATP-dependent protease ClpP protease subunit